MAGHSAFAEMPDTDVMVRVQWGSEVAFSELHRRYFRRLLDFFYGMSRDAQRAEDLCQETFLRLWQLRVRYTVSGSFAAYVFTVARHIWQEQCRTRRREARLEAQGAEVETVRSLLQPSPDELAHRAELDARIFAALDALPEEQRMAFVLRTVQGLSLDDIATIMQCPVNTVRSRRLLAITRLREVLRGMMVFL
jgi:RNA polymerase sigma-70 factor (ECF subfamily)